MMNRYVSTLAFAIALYSAPALAQHGHGAGGGMGSGQTCVEALVSTPAAEGAESSGERVQLGKIPDSH